MRKLFVMLVAAAAALAAIGPFASCATVHGATYDWLTLDKLPKAIVYVNTTPQQVQVAEGGLYSFELPPGAYSLTAEYREGNETANRAEENITVAGSGDYTVDLLLFPTGDFFPTDLVEEVPELNISPNDIETPANQQAQQPLVPAVWLFAGAILLALVLPAAMLIFLRGKHAKREQDLPFERQPLRVSVHKAAEPDSGLQKNALSAEQKEVVEKIRAAGGSIGQKDLRRTIRVSEAKASNLVSELEAMGLLKKVKKGRGNLIKLLE